MEFQNYKTVIPVTDKTNEQLKDIRAILWTRGYKIKSQKEAIAYVTEKAHKELLQEVDKELQNAEEIESK